MLTRSGKSGDRSGGNELILDNLEKLQEAGANVTVRVPDVECLVTASLG